MILEKSHLWLGKMVQVLERPGIQPSPWVRLGVSGVSSVSPGFKQKGCWRLDNGGLTPVSLQSLGIKATDRSVPAGGTPQLTKGGTGSPGTGLIRALLDLPRTNLAGTLCAACLDTAGTGQGWRLAGSRGDREGDTGRGIAASQLSLTY